MIQQTQVAQLVGQSSAKPRVGGLTLTVLLIPSHMSSLDKTLNP